MTSTADRRRAIRAARKPKSPMNTGDIVFVDFGASDVYQGLATVTRPTMSDRVWVEMHKRLPAQYIQEIDVYHGEYVLVKRATE